MGNPGRVPRVRRAFRVDWADTDATRKMGWPLADFHALERLALGAGVHLAQEISIRVRRAILAGMAKAGMDAP